MSEEIARRIVQKNGLIMIDDPPSPPNTVRKDSLSCGHLVVGDPRTRVGDWVSCPRCTKLHTS